MKLFSALANLCSKIAILFLVLAFVGCNAVKYVGEDQHLLTKNTILVDEKKVSDETIKNLILQKPNSSVLGYPLRLNLYNLAKKNPDSSYQNWLNKKEKRVNRLENLLSKKQVDRLGNSFVVKGYSDLLKRIGEPAAIIDTARTRKSMERLSAYYYNKGFFNNNVDYEITPVKRKKRAELIYKVNRGKPYFVDSLSSNIQSFDLDSLYRKNIANSLIKQNQQFDLSNFQAERERLTTAFRNSGIYNFQESSISFDVLRDTSMVTDNQKMDVELSIKSSPSGGNTGNSEYSVHRFKKINIFTDYGPTTVRDSLKSVEYRGYTIWYDNELKYRPKALTDAIFFEKDSVYSDLDRTRTLRQITNLNTFKYPNIAFVADTVQSQLTSNIYLAPRPKYSLGLDLDISRSNIQQVGIGLSTSIIMRNAFGGSETLSFSARGSIGVLDDPISDENLTSEFGGDINLTFPRIWFPLNTQKVIPYYMTPQTRLSAGTNFQKNIGLDRQSLNSILSYNWEPNNLIRNAVELMNIEYVRNTNPNAFFNVYTTTYNRLNAIALKDEFLNNPDFSTFYDEDNNLTIPGGAEDFIDAVTQPGFDIEEDDLSEVKSIEEREERLTENNLIFSSSYVFQKNNRQNINDNSFYSFRLRLESAGNFLSLAEKVIPFNQNDGKGLVFSVPYTQYVKTELDFIKYWNLRNSKVLAFHSFFGMAVPYGNSESIPFVRSYFAGGSNDNRAWNVYSLGPGSTDNLNDFNEANMKISLNLEYRFPIVGDIKGAFFADAGNIWNVFDNEDNPDAIFDGFSSLEDIALGTGFGLRYDFTYFVIRLDTGFKTYNPALDSSNRWFTDFNFKEAVFNIGINYPF